jgi:hypothetical protein
MKGIREIEKLNQKSFDLVRRKNEQDIKTIQNLFDSHKSDIRKVHDREIIELRQEHQKDIVSEADRKEKILTEMRGHLDQTKKFTEKELKNLEDHKEKETIEIQQKNVIDRDRLNSENELFLEDLNDRFNQASRNITSQGRENLESTKKRMHEEAQKQFNYYQNKLSDQSRQFNQRFTHDEIKNKESKEAQDKSFKNERKTTNLRQQHELKKMSDSHTTQIGKRDENFRKGLKEQDLFFEKKFTHQLNKHNSDFKVLEDKNTKVVEDLKTSLTKELTTAARRQDDPFYKFEAIRPELKQFEDRVEISVKVPEHSKQDMYLSINGKEAIVNFNRRYSDASRGLDGTINKINKVETFTTRVPTGHILDPKSVKTRFDDGILTYTIKRA